MYSNFVLVNAAGPTLIITRKHHTLLAIGAALAIILWAGTAMANDDEGPAFRSRVDVGLGSAGEDAFFLILLEQGFSVKGFDLVLSGPLRFRIVDKDPQEDGVPRDQDWDDSSDYARILRHMIFEHAWDDAELHVRVGELDGVGLGHGSIVDHYYNSSDMDHYQGGIELGGHVSGTGVEYLMENVVQPEIFAGRIFFAPFAWFMKGDWPRRLEFGYTLFADTAVPNPSSASSSDNLVVTGGDVALTVLDTSVVRATPYFDLMVMDGEPGMHVGASTSWTLSEPKGVFLHVRAEYRRLGRDYHPAIGNPFYERNRRFHVGTDPLTGQTYSITEHLQQVDDDKRNGFMADLIFDWDGTAKFEARYDFQGLGMPHWVMFRADITPGERFSLGLFYAGQDKRGDSGLFSTDSLIGASLNIGAWGPMRFFAEFTRRWRRIGASMPYANESAGGVGLLFSY